MTYFVLNYDSLGYFGRQKWRFGTLVGVPLCYFRMHETLKCPNHS